MVVKWWSKFVYLFCSKKIDMATINYSLLTKSENAQIYIRFSIDRERRFRIKTGQTINPSNWSDKTKLPKTSSVELKNLKTDLVNLQAFVLNEYNSDYSKGIVFSKEWLQSKIDAYYNRLDEKIDLNYISNYVQYFIDNRKLSQDFKETTNQKFKTLQTKISSFEKSINKNYLLKDFDQRLFNEFRSWLINKNNLQLSTANRTLKNLKTILRDARFNGYTINHQVDGIKLEVPKSKKIYLSFDEIAIIKKKTFLDMTLNYAKDWLIIGCNVGQRVGDLMKMNKNQIFTRTNSDGKEFEFIELTQEKTGQNVTIPISQEVKEILSKYNGNFPPVFSDVPSSNATLFNRHIKIVCEMANINDEVKGLVYNDNLKKNELVETEKYNLVSSHICRRSFATNHYADKRFPTPLIMAITGHKTERVFLDYIGKNQTDYAMEMAETFAEIETLKQVN